MLYHLAMTPCDNTKVSILTPKMLQGMDDLFLQSVNARMPTY